MKIAILINTFHKGKGMDYVAEQQAKELCESGNKVTIYTFDCDHQINNIAIKEIGWPKMMVPNLLYRLLFSFDFLKNEKLAKEISQYDLVIAHFYPITHLAYLAKRKQNTLKYIYYNHGIGGSLSKNSPTLRKIYLKILGKAQEKTFSNADLIVSISYFIDKTIKPLGIPSCVVYNHVDIKKFDTEPSSEAIRNLGLPRSGPKFLYVGVLTQSKGIELLIDSFIKVKKTYLDAKLIIIGSPSFGFDYKKLGIDNSEDIMFLGFIKDSQVVGHIYRSCDVYVSSSMRESFNLPAVEAQMMGKPVVLFNIGAHNEIVKDGVSGILVDPFDTVKFANAMIAVYKNKDQMGLEARKWAEKFSTESKELMTISKIVSNITKA